MLACFETWTISPNVNDQSGVIESHGTTSSYKALDVYPVIYLKSNVTITGGIGTSSKPYLIDGDIYKSWIMYMKYRNDYAFV